MADLWDFVATRRRGVLATVKRDGRPQLSNVLYGVNPDERTILVSVTDDRAKVSNIRRDPRVSFHVTSDDFWQYVVADGDAVLSAVAAAPDDEAVNELVALYRVLQGEHPDWNDFRRAMVADRRLVLRIHVTHLYGQA